MGWMFNIVGPSIARLQQLARNSEVFILPILTALRETLRPCDALLVESKGQISRDSLEVGFIASALVYLPFY